MNVLHVGCGASKIPAEFGLGHFEEVRLDIDPGMEPDIVASMTDMGEIGPFDALYSTHSLEHLYAHEVPTALAEFLRVLRSGGFAMVIVPDLEGVKPTADVLYFSPAGPICGLDMYYGKHDLVKGNPHMEHHCGFVSETLAAALVAAGFEEPKMIRGAFNLMAIARKP